MSRPNRTSRSNPALGLNAILATVRNTVFTWSLLLLGVWLPAFGFFGWGHIQAQTMATERHLILKWVEPSAWADGLELPDEDWRQVQEAADMFLRALGILEPQNK